MTLLAAILAAFWTGTLSAVAPCPLTTNILAVSFLARRGGSTGAIIMRALAYAAGGLVVYSVLGALAAWGVLNIPSASHFLQLHRLGLLGIVLIPTGMVLSGLLNLRFRLVLSPTMADPSADAGRGTRGAFWLGVLFAISFCPTTAMLFFGNILNAAAQSGAGLLPPVFYGLGATLPVVVLGCLLAGGTHRLAAAMGSVQRIERTVRLITGILFIVAGAVSIVMEFRSW